ncbi:TFIIH/NER complex subunit [Coelomomyces lativittatus]|nr:TFIIH/NER complex subunit [Coelomomyces lativittatus]
MSEHSETCQVCKLDRYLQPDVKILVSSCFHRICEKCINRVFRHGSAPCPICRKVVKKLDMQSQTFEDLFVEKEVRIRKRIQRM